MQCDGHSLYFFSSIGRSKCTICLYWYFRTLGIRSCTNVNVLFPRRVQTAKEFYTNTHSKGRRTNSVEQDIIGVPSCLPHGESCKAIGADELAFCSERTCVIKRHHDMRILVINIRLFMQPVIRTGTECEIARLTVWLHSSNLLAMRSLGLPTASKNPSSMRPQKL